MTIAWFKTKNVYLIDGKRIYSEHPIIELFVVYSVIVLVFSLCYFMLVKWAITTIALLIVLIYDLKKNKI